MQTDGTEIADLVAKEVDEGLLPPSSCMGCGDSNAETRENWAICQRVDRRFEDRGEKKVTVYTSSWIPFFFQLPSNDVVEIKEGEDIVCPVPLKACDRCWSEIDGGPKLRLYHGLSQILFFASVVVFMIWVITAGRAIDSLLIAAASLFIASVPFNLLATNITNSRPQRLKGFAKSEKRYEELLERFPNAQIQKTKPNALMEEEPDDLGIGLN